MNISTPLNNMHCLFAFHLAIEERVVINEPRMFVHRQQPTGSSPALGQAVSTDSTECGNCLNPETVLTSENHCSFHVTSPVIG